MKLKKQKRMLLTLASVFVIFCIGYAFLLYYNKQQELAAEAETESTEITCYPEGFDADAITQISWQYENETLSFSLKEEKNEENSTGTETNMNENETSFSEVTEANTTENSTDSAENITSTAVWKYDADQSFPVNQSSLSGMQTTLQALTASRKIQDSLEQAADYGLDTPVQQVTVTDESGNTCTLYFGDTNASADVTYLYTSQEDGIYTVASDVVDYFSHKLLDVITFDELPAPDGTEIYQKIQIASADNNLTLNYKEDGDLTLDYLDQCSWFASLNGTDFAASESAISSLTDAFSSLAVSECAAYKATAEEKTAYGFDNPTAVLTFNYTTTETVESDESSETEAAAQTIEVPHTFTLTVGNASGDYYYVTWNSISQIYLMEASVLETFFNCDKASLIYSTPFYFNLSDISDMTVDYEDNNYHYKIEKTTETAETTDEDGETTTEEQTTTTYYLNDSEIEYSDFSSVFSQLQDLTAEGLYSEEYADSLSDEGQITLTFKLNRSERSQVVLLLKPCGNNYYALFMDGEAAFLMNKTDIAAFVDALVE